MYFWLVFLIFLTKKKIQFVDSLDCLELMKIGEKIHLGMNQSEDYPQQHLNMNDIKKISGF